jgi:hypothetical protein
VPAVELGRGEGVGELAAEGEGGGTRLAMTELDCQSLESWNEETRRTRRWQGTEGRDAPSPHTNDGDETTATAGN